MDDNPGDIANYLIAQHGHAGAMNEAIRETYEAQETGRFYDLSIWREVKTILRRLAEEDGTKAARSLLHGAAVSGGKREA